MVNAFLAQASTEHAADAGKALGGMLVLLGFLALAVLCIVKAFTRRTAGWIVAGSLFGLLMAVFLTLFFVGVVKGMEQRAADRSSSASSVDSDGSGSADSPAKPPATELVRGRDIAYSIRVPVTWTTKREREDFDTLSSFKSIYVGVIAEEAELGTPEVIADVARKRVSKVGTDIHWSEPTALTLDGRSWLEFSVDCKVENIPFSYRYFVYSGHEGTFQIIGWTTQNLSERDGPTMRDVMQSFRFPE